MILIISYWLMRTPGFGNAVVVCTPVEPSYVSHALRPGCEPAVPGASDGAADARLERGVPWEVAA
ncbi:MAG: hypothetical protein M3680_09240, partial [Myxococcota bacterium]|nr:hypothetical protein [Myxococcota bacterium]